MKKRTLLLVSFAFFTSLSFSQTGQKGLNDEFNKVELELNTVYFKLKNKLGEADGKALINSQKAWLRFRELNCKFKSQEDSEGGSISGKMKTDCLIEVTHERIKELKALIDGF